MILICKCQAQASAVSSHVGGNISSRENLRNRCMDQKMVPVSMVTGPEIFWRTIAFIRTKSYLFSEQTPRAFKTNCNS